MLTTNKTYPFLFFMGLTLSNFIQLAGILKKIYRYRNFAMESYGFEMCYSEQYIDNVTIYIYLVFKWI